MKIFMSLGIMCIHAHEKFHFYQMLDSCMYLLLLVAVHVSPFNFILFVPVKRRHREKHSCITVFGFVNSSLRIPEEIHIIVWGVATDKRDLCELLFVYRCKSDLVLSL